MNFYKRHLGDIAKACGHLSQGAMGAYDLLLDWHYANELPLPLGKPELYRIGRAFTKAERANVEQVLALFFQRTEAGYLQKRAQEEIARANAQAEINRQVGKLGGRPKGSKNKTETEPNGNRTGTESVSKKNPSQTPDSKELKSPNGDLSAGLPANPSCPQQEIVALYHEALPELRRVREWNDIRRKLLARRWAENPERQSLDWWRAFFGYVRASPFLMGQTTGRDGRPFDCDLEWLIRPSNFAKVIEGKYE